MDRTEDVVYPVGSTLVRLLIGPGRRNAGRLTDEAHPAVRSEIPGAAARAVEAGATLERLEYVGAGGEGIIFRDGPIAYKVARRAGGGRQATQAAALGVLGPLGLGALVHMNVGMEFKKAPDKRRSGLGKADIENIGCAHLLTLGSSGGGIIPQIASLAPQDKRPVNNHAA